MYNNEVSAPALELTVETAPVNAAAEKGSYGQILKSSALVGGAQFLNIAIGIVRTKAMAMILGPGGFGLAGLYQSIVDLTQNIAEIGVNSSGVRQIAEAVGSSDRDRIALTTAVLRRTSLFLGLLGAAVLVIFSRRVSLVTFGNAGRTAAVCLLGTAVLFRIVSAGQGALLQGMRRIADLAKMQVLGAVFGLVLGVPLVYWLRERGVALYVVAVAATGIVTSWWYSRKIKIEVPRVNLAQVRQEAGALLKLGFAFMASGMMTMGVAYVVRVIVLRKVGIEATGFYQSAWTIGGLYVGFILQAMAADFYPRLTGSIHDHETSNRLVNEQARVGLLLAGPGVIATLTFAPLVIAVLYSGKFATAVPILRWVCLGATLQVISWPMGFIIVAKGRQNLFIFSEVAWAVVSLALAWVCIGMFGVTGAGIAFFGSYVFHVFLVYPIARHLSGFRWSADNLRTCALFLSLIGLIFWVSAAFPGIWSQVAGSLAALGAAAYSIRVLHRLVGTDELPRPVRRLLGLLGLDAATVGQ